MSEKQRKLEMARELIREVWTDDLPEDIQKELEQVYDDLRWISEDL